MTVGYHIYNLTGKKGWLLSCYAQGVFYSPLLQLGCTDFISPWCDSSAHFHTLSQELYLVLSGELWLQVEVLPVLLGPRSLLVVQPGITHAVVGGRGPIQHFGMKIPHMNDEKRIVGPVLEPPSDAVFTGRNHALDPKKGFFADLTIEENHNCWLIGLGSAKYLSKEFCLAYMFYKTEDDELATNHPNVLHYHSQSTEWYFTFQGSQELIVGETNVIVPEGHLLRIGENVPHNINSRSYPFEGITMRTPIILGDKIVV